MSLTSTDSPFLHKVGGGPDRDLNTICTKSSIEIDLLFTITGGYSGKNGKLTLPGQELNQNGRAVLGRRHQISPFRQGPGGAGRQGSPTRVGLGYQPDLTTLVCVHDHVRRCAWVLGCFVEATANLGRENKVTFEMRDVFEKDDFMIESHVIEEHQVLM
jgi:hypothetical protein